MDLLDSYLAKIKDVKIIPPALMSIIHLEDDTELSFGKLETYVESDQIIVSRMLKLANSPFFSRGQKITSLRMVITRLGFKTVRAMVAMAMADSIFSNGNYPKFKEEVWEHSIATGVMCQIISDKLKKHHLIDQALLGGLMQDLGKIVLNTLDKNKYTLVLETYLSSQLKIQDIEKDFYGVDNSIMGSGACKMWKLPTVVMEPVAQRYLPLEEQTEIAQVVNFSNVLTRKGGLGKYSKEHEQLYMSYSDFFNIAEEDRDKFVGECLEALKKDELYKFCMNL